MHCMSGCFPLYAKHVDGFSASRLFRPESTLTRQQQTHTLKVLYCARHTYVVCGLRIYLSTINTYISLKLFTTYNHMYAVYQTQICAISENKRKMNTVFTCISSKWARFLFKQIVTWSLRSVFFFFSYFYITSHIFYLYVLLWKSSNFIKI